MNAEPSRATPPFSVRRALTLAAGTLLFATACDTTTPNGPDGNVFAPGKPRYGYGSPEQQAATQRASAERAAAAANSTKTLDSKRLREIKRDPNDTTVDVTPPESKPDKKAATSSDVTGSATTDSTTTTTETTTTPSDAGSTTGATGSTTTTESTPTESKPAVTREDLPFGQPVVGKKGYVYSPYAPDKGQVDVDGIPAGTKVKCPYTGKVFRVP